MGVRRKVDSSPRPAPPPVTKRPGLCLCKNMIGWLVDVGGAKGVPECIVISRSAVLSRLQLEYFTAKAGLCSKPSNTLHLHY
ncbi:hypothetical protein Q5P01_007782 [Channa striata]|uniref:Uncharacterized protein n=1 Tax=Channa striata TaxID=64152 RepID=A0AA88NCQ6_CHASR|nr:hypothetical protein Q5P01_007782 [Channa striata]